MEDNILGMMWVEKHRPKELSDVVLIESHKDFFEKCLNKKEIPNILLAGNPGSGKSCISRILVDKLISNKMDLLMYNGSNETGINKIREDVEGFLRTPKMSANHKIVYIEEFERLSGAAQCMLKDVFEKYYENGRFICNTNHKSKIEPALISRFQVFDFKRLSDEFIVQYCEKILKSENIKYNIEDVKLLVQSVSPDVRKIVNTLEQSCHGGELKNLDKESIVGIEKKIIGLIIQLCENINNISVINKNVADIQDELARQEIDYFSVYEQLFNSQIPLWAKIEVNKYCNMHQQSAIPQIHFVAMTWSIINNGINYTRTFSETK